MKSLPRTAIAALALLAGSMTAASAATTCSIDQTGEIVTTSWLVNAPKNISEIVQNKLKLAAFAAGADGRVAAAELPSAIITCFGDDGAPNLIQKVRIVAKDKNTGKVCPVVNSFLKDGGAISKSCDAEFEAVVSLP